MKGKFSFESKPFAVMAVAVIVAGLLGLAGVPPFRSIALMALGLVLFAMGVAGVAYCLMGLYYSFTISTEELASDPMKPARLAWDLMTHPFRK